MTTRSGQVVQSPGEPARVLLVSPYSDDHLLLPEILKHPNWLWHRSFGCRQALGILNEEVAVIICVCEHPDGGWRDLLNGAAKFTVPPRLIVCSRLADERLWGEVLNLGGHDVLAKPFDEEEVVRVTYLAWHSWKRQRDKAAAPEPGSASNARAATCLAAA